FDPKKINQAEKEKLKSQLGIKEQIILGYSGSLGTWYLMDEMMAFFARLLQRKPNAILLFVTQDDDHLIYELAQKQGVPESHLIVRKANRNEMPLYLSIMDFSVMFIKPSFSKKASSPTKLGELMAMGVPVVCNGDVGDVEAIVTKYKAGVVLNELDDASFDSAIEKIIKDNDWFDVDLMRNGAVEYYDLDKGVEKYDRIYNDL
ncbi:MAG TPA: glycosyltransferase, partial [Bacteroidetes bacterium]|nr:glycosyltransferase [Bacteroidota bacterium]